MSFMEQKPPPPLQLVLGGGLDEGPRALSTRVTRVAISPCFYRRSWFPSIHRICFSASKCHPISL